MRKRGEGGVIGEGRGGLIFFCEMIFERILTKVDSWGWGVFRFLAFFGFFSGFH